MSNPYKDTERLKEVKQYLEYTNTLNLTRLIGLEKRIKQVRILSIYNKSIGFYSRTFLMNNCVWYGKSYV